MVGPAAALNDIWGSRNFGNVDNQNGPKFAAIEGYQTGSPASFASGALRQADRLSVVGLIRRSHVLVDDGSAQRFGSDELIHVGLRFIRTAQDPRLEAAPSR